MQPELPEERRESQGHEEVPGRQTEIHILYIYFFKNALFLVDELDVTVDRDRGCFRAMHATVSTLVVVAAAAAVALVVAAVAILLKYSMFIFADFEI